MTFEYLSPELDDKPPTLEVPAGGEVLSWGNDCLRLQILHGEDLAPRLLAVHHVDIPLSNAGELSRSSMPVVEIALSGDGRHATAGKRHVDGAAAQRLRLTGTREFEDGVVRRLELQATYPLSGLTATVHYELAAGSSVLRSWTELRAGTSAVGVEYVSSLFRDRDPGCRGDIAEDRHFLPQGRSRFCGHLHSPTLTPAKQGQGPQVG